MHPADQFEAFAALVAEGRSIEDIAADFSVTPLVVQRRLKLANVSPRLLADYRAEAVSLDQLMALAITDDHAAQESAFYDAPTWQRSPHNLRDRLTEREIDAYRHPLVRFVGLDTYEREGGGIRRDLFAEGDKGVSDRCRAAGTAGAGQAGGHRRRSAGRRLGVVDATPGMTHADLQAFQRAPRSAARTSATRSASRSCKPRCTNWPKPWMPRWTPTTKKGRCLAGGRRTPGRAVAGAGRWFAGLCGQREGRSRCHRQHRPRRAGRDSSRAAARSRGQGIAHAGTAAAAFRQRRRSRERRRRRERIRRQAAQGRRHVRPTGPAVECPPHGGAAIEVARHPQVALAALVHGMVQTVLQESYYGHDLPLV